MNGPWTIARHALIALAAIIVGHAALTFAVLPSPEPEEVTRFRKLPRDVPDAIFFGDSTVLSISDADADTRPLGEMVVGRLAPRRVAVVAHYAYPPSVYTAYARALADWPEAPRAVLIPINLRAFSVRWRARPDWQFVREKFFLRHSESFSRLAFRPFAAFRVVDLQPFDSVDYRKMPVEVRGRIAGNVSEFEFGDSTATDDHYRREFESLYLYTLSTDNPEFEALIDLARSLRARGIEAAFYISPIDWERGEQHAGPGFMDHVMKNIALIAGALREADAGVHDFSTLFGSERFIYRHDVNEHLDDIGRRELAVRLGRILEDDLQRSSE